MDDCIGKTNYGVKMAEIQSNAKPFHIAKIQYASNWNEGGTEAANFYLNLTKQLYVYRIPFVSRNPK
ncbi:hypothetical protein LIER_41584 [Lithospermum erythrorhizon]|uniref:Uncharacterized protein n=1 Tax=Lithospermum erythrorhizon TaxID=34254 RepID=A0AAV3REU9_LITER